VAQFEIGDTVLIPVEVVAIENGRPYGTYTVYMEYASDDLGLLDGITAIVPQVVATLQQEEDNT